MFKRIAALFTTLIFVFISTSSLLPVKTAYAYQNSSYYNNIKIGLKSMAATSINITLNGAYSVNGQVITAGTTAALTIGNSYVMFNGTGYDTLTFMPQNKSNTLSITSGATTYKYFGTMSFKVVSGKIFPINSLNIEDYLKGVVGLEMSDYFPVEALKAQAVAARNYTLANLGLYASSGYDLTDTIDCQVYGGYNESYKNVIKAVDETKGKIQLYNDTLVQAFYSASSGGYTEASENVWYSAFPYLKSKTDSFESENWPGGNRSFTNAQIETTLKSKGYLISTDKFVKIDLNTITRYASGRVSNIDVIYNDVNGAQGKKSFAKTKASSFLSLPSSLYNVSYDSINGIYTFSGKGYGHGVGLSQLGAKYRAAAGQSYQQILNFYYDGSYTANLLAIVDSFTVNKNTTLVGQAVNFNSTGKGGSGNGYLYKYVVSKDGSTTFTQDYADNANFAYVPTSSGSYSVTLYLKDKLSSEDFDDQETVSFTTADTSKLSSFTINKTSTLVSQGVTISAAATAGSGNGYLYKFEVTNNNSTIYTKDYSDSSTLNYVPTAAGNYSVNIYVKDKISTAAYDDKKTLCFSAYDTPAVNTFTIDKSSVLTGQAINANVTGKLGSSSSYLYKYVINKDGQSVYTKDFSQTSALSYIPTASGSYTVTVYLKDTVTASAYDDTETLSFTAYTAPTVSSFALDKASTLVGQDININASGKNGSASYLYKFVIVKDNIAVYTQNFSSNAALKYAPSSAGTYTVKVYLKDVISGASYDDEEALSFLACDVPTLDSFTADKFSTLVTQAICINASVSKGSGSGYLYKYVVNKDGTSVFTQDFSENKTLSYDPSSAGNYCVTVYVKDKISNASYDIKGSIDFTAYSLPAIDNSILDKVQTLVGQSITLSSTVKNGSGLGYKYKYVVAKDGVTVLTQDYSNYDSFSYTPSASGSYAVTLYVKDNISTSEYDSKNSSTFMVYDVPQIAAVNASGTLYEKRPITISVQTMGGSPSGISYKYEVYKDGVLISSKDFSSQTSYSFTPVVYGSYVVKTYIKDGISINLLDNVKETSLAILREPVVVSKLPIYWGMKGSDVVQIQTALTNLGFSVGTIDGIFGSKTNTAVINFQKSKGIIATGTVDLQTFNALNDAIIAKLTN